MRYINQSCLFGLLCALALCTACADPKDAPNNSSGDMSSDLPKVADMASDLTDMSADQDTRDMPLDQIRDLDMATDMVLDMSMTFPLMGFGELMGMCNEIDDELGATQSIVIQNTIHFADDPYDMGDFMRLSMGGQEIITDGNAGGSSVMSEVFAYEVLYRCELAVLLKTETEVTYKTMGKITDLLVEIDGKKVGVSVTRAVKFPRDEATQYTLEQANDLLKKKFEGITESSENVTSEDKWVKQILHVLAYDKQHADMLMQAFKAMSPEIKKDSILWITITEGMDEFIY